MSSFAGAVKREATALWSSPGAFVALTVFNFAFYLMFLGPLSMALVILIANSLSIVFRNQMVWMWLLTRIIILVQLSLVALYVLVSSLG